jgi:ribose transport system permease protein
MKNRKLFTARTEVAIFIIIAGLFIFLFFATPNFKEARNLMNILRQASISGVVAIAATFVIVSGGIDLSLGAITGLSAMCVALMLKAGMSIPLSITVAILLGALVGLYNGVLIYETKIAPFIATLGTMTIVRGIVKISCNAKTITGFPESFVNFAMIEIGGFLPTLFILWIAMVAIGFLIMCYTCFGRNIYVIGSGIEVAKLSGINVRLNTYGIYAMSGLLCAIAGIMLTARVSSAVPTGGQGYEMNAIAAAVIGGASLQGARGTVIGTFFGTLLITMISNGGIHMKIDPFIMEVVTGVIITLAVVVDQMRKRS